jgi:hypothetical protein
VTGRFTLATTHPKVPTLNINVFGTVREPLTVYPSEITFSGLNKAWVDEHPEDVSLNKTVTLSFDQGGELQVTSVTSTIPNLKTDVQTLDANKRYSVKLHLQPPLKVGDFKGEVKIVTNMKTLTIPVKGKIFSNSGVGMHKPGERSPGFPFLYVFISNFEFRIWDLTNPKSAIRNPK